jgi:starch-binding outer membrane protein, SusD/RagB family
MTKVGAMTDAQIDAKDRTEIVAEARFMRAFYHMQLLLNWEKIVNRDVYITSSGELDKAMSERPDSWNFIVDDLQKAGADLPQKRPADNLGRATSGSAYAYLGFAYLTMASEQPEKKTEYLNEALKAFDNVKGYELESNFLSMFNGTNKNCKESIFEIQFSMSSVSGAWYRTYLHKWIGTSAFGGWDEIAPSQALMNEFKKEGKLNNGMYDARLYESVYFNDPYFNDGTGKVYDYDFKDWVKDPEERDRVLQFRKFMPPTKAALGQKHTDVNIPLMRYANVLLMKAEALNDLGRTGEAIPLINDVRRVHGNMPAMTGTTQAEVQAQIEHERMIEFPMENLRWYDLRRWGKTAEAMAAIGRTGFDKSKLFYPTPQTELNSNRLAK